MTVEQLKQLMECDEFHHATYRNIGTLHEGLWIYRKSTTGFRGFEVVDAFLKSSPELREAEALVAPSGVSVGAYGQG